MAVTPSKCMTRLHEAIPSLDPVLSISADILWFVRSPWFPRKWRYSRAPLPAPGTPAGTPLEHPQTVEEIPPAHSLVLNKFNTMTDHALIITREFQPQEEALTEYGEHGARVGAGSAADCERATTHSNSSLLCYKDCSRSSMTATRPHFEGVLNM